MKAVLRISNMYSSADVNNVRKAIANNEGVIACQISKEKQEIDIVYDQFFITEDELVASLEDCGYTVI